MLTLHLQEMSECYGSPRMLDVMTVKDIYSKLIVPCIGRDGYWVSEKYICIFSVVYSSFRKGAAVSVVWHCILYLLSFSTQASPGLRSALQAFEYFLHDTRSSCRMAEAARMLGEKRVCKVDVDVCISVVFYCLEREELQTALRELSRIVSTSMYMFVYL